MNLNMNSLIDVSDKDSLESTTFDISDVSQVTVTLLAGLGLMYGIKKMMGYMNGSIPFPFYPTVDRLHYSNLSKLIDSKYIQKQRNKNLRKNRRTKFLSFSNNFYSDLVPRLK